MTGLNIALVIVAIMLIITILLQQRSVGLGGAFGGDSAVFTSRRGAEKSLYRLTILLGILLCALVLWSAWLSRPAPTAAVTTNSANSAAVPADATTTPNQ